MIDQETTPLDRILDQLDNVRRSGGGYSARCPAHDDNNNSLSLTEGEDGRVLVKCHASCPAAEIVAALDMTMGDLFPGGGEIPTPKMRRDGHAGEPTPPATYHYHDADGLLLFQVVRSEGKRFRQRRPDGRGGWVWDLQGVERVLYRLPQLVRADPAEPVFITEGEKDADNLARLGLPATCNSGGAGKWRDAYNEALRGRDVIILPDNDDAGRDHAERVASSLHGVAATVKVDVTPER